MPNNYKELFKTVSKEKRVYSRDKKHIGIIIADAAPYMGDAGYSSRVKVLWKDGKTTICTVKGMKPYYNSWVIL